MKLALCLVTGCSFATVSGPSAVTPDGGGDLACTTSHTAPIVDVILTAVQIVDFSLTAHESSAQWDGHFCAAGDPTCSAPVSRGVAIAAYTALGLASAASAAYGFTLVARCHEAHAAIGAGELGTKHATP